MWDFGLFEKYKGWGTSSVFGGKKPAFCFFFVCCGLK